MEVVDQVIDNCCELGDASVTIEGCRIQLVLYRVLLVF